MKVTHLVVLVLVSMLVACSSESSPAKHVVVAAADAARHSEPDQLVNGASSPIVAVLPTRPCSVVLGNGEPHSGIADMVLQKASLAIQGIAGLSVAESGQGDLELLLFRTERADRGDQAWDDPPSLDRAPGSFRVAYVVLGENDRYLAGDLIACKGEYQECGERMAVRVLRVCQSLDR